MVRNVLRALSDAKGQDVTLADAHAGMGVGLLRGAQPSGTHEMGLMG